jgi:hypothetical protein
MLALSAPSLYAQQAALESGIDLKTLDQHAPAG